MSDPARAERIAIVAVGCRFPGGASGPERFWQLLSDGVDAITEIPSSRFDARALFDADAGSPGKLYTRWGGFADDVDAFDAAFFGISPREAVRIDPQQRLLLEVVWEALEDGGLRADQLAGSRTGVFIGISTHDYYDLLVNPPNRHRIDAHSSTGTATSIAANRISYVYDFRGPSIAIDTACSSSLTALHLACRSLRAGECDLAVAGGVNAFLTPEVAIGFCRASMLSPDGRCMAFDARANGFVRGEGAGVVVLKRLDAALAAGDRIYAVVRGTAVNQDGRTVGLTVPSAEAQEALMREALRDAGVEPRAVQYVEAHGTGTRVGDPIEAAAIGRVLSEGRLAATPCLVGSVKTNIGHLEAAAGIAGVIKTALALAHDRIPASLHFRSANPEIPLDELGLRVVTTLEPWPCDGPPPIAGVNSFGFGGANAHAVLEAAPRRDERAASGDGAYAHILPVSARHPESLRRLAQAYRESLARPGCAALGDLCHSASVRRSHHAQRAAFVGSTHDEMVEQIDAFLSRDEGRAAAARAGRRDARIAFVFTGMGPQWWGMGRQLLESEPVFRAAVEECDRLFREIGTWSLLDALMADEGVSRVHEADLAPAANLAIQVGLTHLWRAWGVVADAIVGHSAGEIGAAWAAGALTLADALRIAFHRGRLQHRTAGTGTMLAAGVSDAEAAGLIEGVTDRVSVAAVNSPVSVTFSGERAALEQISAELTRRGRFNRFLPVDVPYHAPALESVRAEFIDALAPLAPRPPAIPLMSTVTGAPVGDAALDARYWYDNLRRPVLFAAALGRLADEGFDTFLEIGPHPVLAASIAECLSARSAPVVTLPSLRRKEDERRILLRSLAALYARGNRVEWAAVYPRGAFVPLPRYPWQRERHWLEPEPHGDGRPRGEDSGHPLLGYRLRSVRPTWEVDAGAATLAYLEDHIVQGSPVFPAAAYCEMALAAGAQISPGATAVVEEIEFRKVLFLTQRSETLVQLHHDPRDGSFEIHSATNEPGAPWTAHAAGRLGTRAGDAASEPIDPDVLRERCGTEVSVDETYRALDERGLHYQGAFRGIGALWRGTGEALARIALPASASDAASYRVHPALLDSAFQSMLVAAETHAHGLRASGLYLPVAIRRLTLSGEPGPACWSHATVTRCDADVLEGDIVILGDDGTVAVRVEGLRCKALESRSAQSGIDELFYDLEWRLKPLGTARRERVAVRRGDELAAHLQPVADEVAQACGWLERRGRLEPLVESIAMHFARAALIRLGRDVSAQRARVDGEVPGIAPAHRRFFGRLVEIADGASGREGAPGSAAAERAAAEEICDRVLREISGCDPLVDLMRRCGRRLDDILSGELDPREVLFTPDAVNSWTRFFAEDAAYTFYNDLMAETIAGALEHVRADAPVRILEIGAGTGGTTAPVLARLGDRQLEYHFTDVSTFFLAQARERFGDRPAVRVRSLDIESDPIAQLGAESFDVIIAANVVHATADIRATLGHIRALLAPGGLLALLEASRRMAWLDLIFGVTEGWWRFTDTDLRPDHGLLSPDRWREVLTTSGFEGVACVSDPPGVHGSIQTVLLATRPAEAAGAPVATRETRDWILFQDAGGVGARLGAQLRARGDRCVVVRRGNDYARELNDVRLATDHPDHVRRLVEELSADGFRFDGVIHAAALDLADPAPLTAAQVVAATQAACATAVAALQGFEKAGRALPATWLLTSGTQPVQPADSCERVTQSALWGLGRVLANELSETRCHVVDLSRDVDDRELDALLDELEADDLEEDVALRGTQRWVGRLRRTPRDARRVVPMRSLSPDTHRFRLEVDSPGALETLTLRETPAAPPGPGEVLIRVMAAGLNFRDVMLSLGMLPPMAIPGAAGRTILGFECAGVVLECGAGVTHLRAGDEVVGIALGAFASQVATRAEMVVPKPAQLSFEQAATIPLVFITAHYGLTHLARLGAGERVLIHAATGGVGLAAIQLARRAGACIFATAGSPEKRVHLNAMGIEYVMDSRSLGFADDVLAATDGEGVDVVLNSLAGEAIPRGLGLLRPYGRFLELGKRDILADARIGLLPFDRNLSFSSIALDRMCVDRPAFVGAMLGEVMDLVADGALEPIPHTAFDLAEAEPALRFLAQAKHIGKLVLTVREPTYQVAPAADGPLCRADATYVVSGGLGGFGLAVARWLAEQGAGHIVLMSRSGAPAAENRAAFEAVRQYSARVVVFQGDVGDESDVRGMLEQIRQSMPPLRGIVHGAMVLDDALIAHVTPERFHTVLWPKAGGAWNLHRQSAAEELDFFVMFSSIASLLSMRGQGNYAAANAFLDGLAYYRQAQGLPALTINWGALGGVGYLSRNQDVMHRLNQHGLDNLSPPEALAGLEHALRAGMTRAAIMRFDWARWSSIDQTSALLKKAKRLDDFISVARSQSAEAARDGGSPLALLAAAAPEQRRVLLESQLVERVARVLGASAQKVDPAQRLIDMGIDSLMAVELQTIVKRDFDVALPLGALLEGATAGELATRVLDQLALEAAPPEPSPAPAPRTDGAQAEARVDAASFTPGENGGGSAPSGVAVTDTGAALHAPAPNGGARAAVHHELSPSAPGEGARARDGIDYGAIDYSRWTPTLSVVRRVCALLLRLIARIEVTGLANIPRSGPVVVAVNHLSMIDVVVLLTVLPRRGICFAADRLLKLPVVRWFLDLGDSIYVRRGEADREALERALAVLRAGGLLGVAPEGTRSRTGGLGRGRTGVAYLAASASAPVVPVAAWGQEQIPRNLRRFRRTAVRVRIGTPLPVEPGDRTAAGLQHETDRVMEAIAAMLPPAYRGVYDNAAESTSLTPAS